MRSFVSPLPHGLLPRLLAAFALLMIALPVACLVPVASASRERAAGDTQREVKSRRPGKALTPSGTLPASEPAPPGAQPRTCAGEPCPLAAPAPASTPSTSGVRVGPDGDGVLVSAGAGTHMFAVRNTGGASATFTLTAECRAGESGTVLSGCSTQPAVTVAAGTTVFVNASFPATAGSYLTVTLTAAQQGLAGVQDAGWVNVSVQGPASGTPAPPTIRAVNLNSDAWPVRRGECVTVSVGPGAAYECGDLRLAHALPTQRNLGRAWAPVLLYNSQHADPRPTLYYDVTVPSGSAVPASIDIVMYLADTHQSWSVPFAGNWQPGVTRRVAVQFEPGARTSGRYGYYVQAIAKWSDGQISSPVISSAYTVINRRGSPFGAGWWMAGVESLCGGCALFSGWMLWTGGDGSTRYYEPTGTGVTWVSRNPDGPPDVVELVNGTYYKRTLRGGGEIHFDAYGQHIRTVNRLRQVTTFHWAGGRLELIEMPAAAGAAAPSYDLVYDANGRLARVDALTPGAPARTVTVGRELGDGRTTWLQDPDGQRVRFAYTRTARPYLVTRRTGKRNDALAFAFSSSGRLTGTRLPVTATDTIVQTFEPVEDRGLTGSVLLASAYTMLDGPRRDVTDRTYIWPTDYGAPRRIRDALGAETVILRDDPDFPVLPTQVMGPGGHSQVVYDSLGRVESSMRYAPFGDLRYTLLRYRYDDRWDAPTEIRTDWVDGSTGVAYPLAGTVSMAYDEVGNPGWRQLGDALVHFRYYASGQLRAVQSPAPGGGGSAVDSLVYDDRGNLALTVSPAGLLTQHVRDRYGRDSVVITPTSDAGARTLDGLASTGVRRLTLYDAMDRDTLTVTTGPRMVHTPQPGWGPGESPAQTVSVRTSRDPGGAPLRVARWATPDPAGVDTLVTSYLYDPAGRVQRLIEGHETQRFGYDGAGNQTLWTTGRGHTVTSGYDVLGRLLWRTVPAVYYAPECHVLNVGASSGGGGGGGDPPPNDSLQEPTSAGPGAVESSGTTTTTSTTPCSRYPEYPNDGAGGLVIPEETTRYRYDAAGNMVYAENGDAVIERSYFPNGLVRDEMQRLRTYTGTDFSRHVYQVGYGYDMLGRLTAVRHPAVLAGGNARDTLAYALATGALESATDRVGTRFDFGYNAAGANTSLRQSYNGALAVVDSMQYDPEGRRIWRSEYQAVAPGHHLHLETYAWDARGKLLTVTDTWYGATHANWYTGLGTLAATYWGNLMNPAYTIEEFRTDALGNAYGQRSGPTGARSYYPWHTSTYDAGTGRVALTLTQPPEMPAGEYSPEETSRSFDPSGNLDWSVRRVYAQYDPGWVGRHSRSRSFYDAGERLRYFQKNDVGISDDGSRLERSGVWEEYRYDPLGRRIMVRSDQSRLCSSSTQVQCVSHITRYVWSGDQVLWELRAPGGSGVDLEQTWGSDDQMGWVSYFHARDIDRPLTITKYGKGTVVTHQNWRGQFARGTFQNGQFSDYEYRATSTSPYLHVPWPGWRTTAWHEETQPRDVRHWWGELVDGMRDGSGQLYMRNRYYDPQTGQFTQPDPIGIAGGLNVYGFASGDPVSYADPYGLCAAHKVQLPADPDEPERVCPGNLTHGEYYQREDGFVVQATAQSPAAQHTSLGAPRMTVTDEGEYPYLIRLPALVGCPPTAEGYALFPLPGRPHNPFIDLHRRGDREDKRSGSFGYYYGELWDTGRWAEPVHGTAWCKTGLIILHYSHGSVH